MALNLLERLPPFPRQSAAALHAQAEAPRDGSRGEDGGRGKGLGGRGGGGGEGVGEGGKGWGGEAPFCCLSCSKPIF